MPVVVSSFSPVTLGPAGGAIAIVGTFPLALDPFDIYLEDGFNPAIQIGASVSAVGETDLDATIPPATAPAVYSVSVVSVPSGGDFDYGPYTLEITGTPPLVEGVDSVSPAESDQLGTTVVVTGEFSTTIGYYAAVLLDGVVVTWLTESPTFSADGTTLTFTFPAGVDAGVFDLGVTDSIEDPTYLDALQSFTVTAANAPRDPPLTDAARSTSTLTDELEAFLPSYYCGALPLLAGMAAVLHAVEGGVDNLRPEATLELGTDIWLTMAAHGQGILRATSETDASLRIRMRSVDDQVTPPALEAAVNALIAPDTCTLLEWWEHSYLDVELVDEGGLWLDTQRLSGGPSSFLILVPQRGWLSAGSFVDADLWLDNTYIGTESEDSVYAAIINTVHRARAAGVFWRLCLDAA